MQAIINDFPLLGFVKEEEEDPAGNEKNTYLDDFSVGGVETVTATFAFVSKMLEKAAVKNTFSHSPIVATEGEIKVYAHELTDGKDKESVILMKKAKQHFALQGKAIDSVSEVELESYFQSQNAIA